MEQCITYTVKSIADGYVWIFKYNLNGSFKSFEVLDGELSDKQKRWLFGGMTLNIENPKVEVGKFPVTADIIKMVWMKNLKKNFLIIPDEPKVDFETIWNMYDYKVSRYEASQKFKKLSEADKIKLAISIPDYKKFIKAKNVPPRYLATFINQQNYNDDWSKLK